MIKLVWQGIPLTITHTREVFASDFDHIEVHAKERLPITETGYRSHFMYPKELAQFAGPLDFVTQWLDESAKLPEWKAYRSDSRQGELF